jgi:acyl carrier protein
MQPPSDQPTPTSTPSSNPAPALPLADQPIFDRIAEIIRDTLDEPELALTPATTAREVDGWDSIAMINIILDVQKAFNVRFRSSEVDKLASIGDFVGLTRRKIDAEAAPPAENVT